jgi:hypothetical protein
LRTLTLTSKVKISSPVLDLRQHPRLRACMELSPAEIILSLFTAENELVYLEHLLVKPGEKLADSLESLAATNEFFAHSYAQVEIGIAGAHYTLVPNALFDGANKEQLLKFNHAVAADETVLADEIFSAGSYCVYSVEARVKQLFDKVFPNNHMRHQATCLIESLSSLSSKTHKTCLVNVHADRLDIALYHKKLTFFNSFSFQATEDFLYFVLASLEQNGFALEETEIVLAGEIEAGSALHNTLKKYMPLLRFAVGGKGLQRKNDFVKLPDHFYFSLFNLYLCAL